MGLDCTVIFYAGVKLTVEELAGVFRRVADGHLGTMTLAVSHAEAVIAPRGLLRLARAPVHAISCFEKTGRYVLESPVKNQELDRMRQRAAAEDWSLSRIAQEAWRLTRRTVLEGKRVDTEAGAPEATLPDSWQVDVAAAVSQLRRRALWACVADHAARGAYALCREGRVTEKRELEGGDYEGQADRALAALARVREASVQAAFRSPHDEDAVEREWLMLAERGRFLDRSRAMQPADLEQFEHMQG